MSHEILSPSSADRWIHCPPSALINAEEGSRDTVFTREGTLNYEVYKWDGLMLGPDHDISMPFTRMIAGAADYHLGGFRAVTAEEYVPRFHRPLVTCTRAHMLGM